MGTRLIGLLVVAWIVAACAAASAGVHAVDGYWVGAEHECDPVDESTAWREPCTWIVAAAEKALRASDPGSIVVRGVMADVPSHTPDGLRPEDIGRTGILERTFVVLDLAGGSRRVVPQMCHIPLTEGGVAGAVTCAVAPEAMAEWRVGSGAPSRP